jgi:hypothetical protein
LLKPDLRKCFFNTPIPSLRNLITKKVGNRKTKSIVTSVLKVEISILDLVFSISNRNRSVVYFQE